MEVKWSAVTSSIASKASNVLTVHVSEALWNEHLHRVPEDFVGSPAEDLLCPRVVHDYILLVIDGDDGVRRDRDDARELRLRCLERLLGKLSIVDVGGHPDPLLGGTVGADQRHRANGDPTPLSVDMADPVLNREGRFRPSRVTPESLYRFTVLRMKCLEPAEAFQLLVGLAGEGSPGGRIVDRCSLRIGRPDNLGGSSHESLKTLDRLARGREGTSGVLTFSFDARADAADADAHRAEEQRRNDVPGVVQRMQFARKEGRPDDHHRKDGGADAAPQSSEPRADEHARIEKNPCKG